MSNKHNGISPNRRPPGPPAGRIPRAGAAYDRTFDGGFAVNVGHGNFILGDRVIAILESGSLPMKRLRERAAEENMLVDATAGRKTRSLVVTDSRHVVLSALAPATLQERLQECLRGGKPLLTAAERELEEGEFVS